MFRDNQSANDSRQRAFSANVLMRDEARRIAAGIAKVPELLSRKADE